MRRTQILGCDLLKTQCVRRIKSPCLRKVGSICVQGPDFTVTRVWLACQGGPGSLCEEGQAPFFQGEKLCEEGDGSVFEAGWAPSVRRAGA